MMSRISEMRHNEQMERAEQRQHSYEKALGIIHPPPEPQKPDARTYTPTQIDWERIDRSIEAGWEDRRKRDDEIWEWYLANRQDAVCKCGRFRQVCADSGGCNRPTKHKTLVINGKGKR
jgi:hypothetical protein